MPDTVAVGSLLRECHEQKRMDRQSRWIMRVVILALNRVKVLQAIVHVEP